MEMNKCNIDKKFGWKNQLSILLNEKTNDFFIWISLDNSGGWKQNDQVVSIFVESLYLWIGIPPMQFMLPM